ncbi:SMP-30/gluconolactonase/LRE family protein [Nocardioides sp.]|uniref:SMP-30/gluconolactonase/LRE family protein n=1 Tax=Nocardioides sp. TaxID=35761 RepID=UPI00351318BE
MTRHDRRRRGSLVRGLSLAAAAVATGATLLAPPSTAAPAAATTIAGSASSSAADAGSRAPKPYPASLPLPNGFQPEGITIAPGGKAYLGSRADGDIYRLDLRTGRGRVISQGPGTPSVGLKTDGRRLLYVAGGTAGTARVVDQRTGRVVRDFAFSAAPSFVNDVILTRTSAWFTDSARPQLYRVKRASDGRPATSFTTLPLRGDWVQGEGNNANGITTTPDGRALLVVNSSNGNLYRVNPATGVARTVDLRGATLTNGDGLLREGRTLFAVQNRLNRIAVLRLNRAGTAATLVRTITSPRFDVPTTVARFGGSLYLPNARFTTPATPSTTYDVTKVRAGR